MPSVDIVLEPQERRRLKLLVDVQSAGKLYIKGVQWLLAGVVPSEKHFKLHRVFTLAGAKDGVLCIHIDPPMPLLSLQWNGVPDSLLNGQVVETALVLKNISSSPAHNVKIIVSPPCNVFISTDSSKGASGWHPVWLTLIGPADDATHSEKLPFSELNSLDIDGVYIFHVPGAIAPDETISLPTLLRPSVPGVLNLKITVYYERENPKSGRLKCRLLKHQHDVSVPIVNNAPR